MKFGTLHQILNRLQSRDQKLKFLKFKMTAAAILKIAFLAVTHWSISAKFCMRKQNGMSARATWQKLQIFKMQNGGRPPFWKSLNRHISVKNRPILMKCGTLHQILNPITVTWPKIKIFKIQDGGGRHLENRFFGHNSSTDCLISAKFCMRKQNAMFTRAKWQNLQIFKIQDGRRPPFWKSLNRYMSVKNRPILMKFGTYSKCCSHVTKYWIFFKFKMAAAAILKIAFLAITRQLIFWFQRNFALRNRTACRQRPCDKNCKFLKSKISDGRHFENR